MLNTKYKGRYSRKKEMREDLSIILGVQRSRQLAAASGAAVSPPFGQNLQTHQPSPYWQRPVSDFNALGNMTPPGTGRTIRGQLSPMGNVTMGCVPPLVTAAQCRTRFSTPSPGRTRSWGVVAQSLPIFRTPPAPGSGPPQSTRQDNPSRITLPRRAYSSILRHVVRPPQTPIPIPKAACTGISTEQQQKILLQSPWVTRETASAVPKPVESSSQYSIRELLDILCGNGICDKNSEQSEAPLNTSSIRGTSSKAVLESEHKRNEAFALGLLKLPRKPRTPKPQQPSENSTNISHFPAAKRARVTSDHSSAKDFLGLTDLNSFEDTNLSFISTSPVLFEEEPSKMTLNRRLPGRKRVTFQDEHENRPPLF